MKIICSKNSLLKSVSISLKAVPSKTTMPILECILIDATTNQIKFTFQKYGLVKYDAFQEMGGKLSFSLCLLNEKEDGFIINAMHSREGCYTYIKEVIAGNCVIILSEEEKEALEMAKAYR